MATPKKKVKAANPVGRPTKYKPEYCALVIEEMKQGASIEELPLVLDVVCSTIYQWQEQFPEFSEAIKRGVSFSQAWWMKKGRTNLENKEFSATLFYMNMKNRFGWRDKTETTGSMTIKHEDALDELK